MKNNSTLKGFFSPKSVAVVGASEDETKLGYAVVKNLIDGGYVNYGKIFPINLKSDQILGLPCYPSVMDVKEDIELGVIVIPYKFVPDALKSCGEKGIRSVIIISAGFREAGAEGVAREREIVKIAKDFSMRIIGPNVLGVVDTFTPLNASFSADSPPKGPIAITSQSGALGTAILDWAQAGSLGLSKFISIGNKADVNEIDLLNALAKDENSKTICMYIEELSNGQEFMQVAREVAKIKPVVAFKSGVTQSGARAVSSHTGSLAGSEQAYRAGFSQAGVLQVESMQDFFDVALALGYQPSLKGKNIAIITNAGGPGIMATDALEKIGLQVATLENNTKDELKKQLPDAAAVSNPVDVLGDARADRYNFALKVVANDPNVDGLIVILTPQSMTEIKGTAEEIVKLSKTISKPILTCFMGEERVQPGIDYLIQHGIPNYSFPNRAALAYKAMSDYEDFINQPEPVYASFSVDKKAVKQVFDRVKKEGRLTIGDAEARDILTAYGLRIPQSELAETPEQAIEIANKIGYPVVLKISSPDILHKTDVGGVKVGLENDEQLRDAFELMIHRANKNMPSAKIWGCLVQEMIPSDNLEILVGMNRDSQFGPLVTFGLGGIYVETLKDVTFRIAPFSKKDAEDMLKEIRTAALLDGVRGKPPVDKEAIVDVLLRMGQLVQDFPEIMEFDINPLIVFSKGQGAIAIDMRLVLAGDK